MHFFSTGIFLIFVTQKKPGSNPGSESRNSGSRSNEFWSNTGTLRTGENKSSFQKSIAECGFIWKSNILSGPWWIKNLFPYRTSYVFSTISKTRVLFYIKFNFTFVKPGGIVSIQMFSLPLIFLFLTDKFWKRTITNYEKLFVSQNRGLWRPKELTIEWILFFDKKGTWTG